MNNFIGASGSSGRFGERPSRQQLELDYFYCGGNENSLLECHRVVGGACSQTLVAEVVCS